MSGENRNTVKVSVVHVTLSTDLMGLVVVGEVESGYPVTGAGRIVTSIVGGGDLRLGTCGSRTSDVVAVGVHDAAG